MGCKILWTKLIPFFLAFLVGLVSIYFLKENLMNENSSEQVLPLKSEILLPRNLNCYAGKFDEPFKDKFINDIYKKRLKEKSNLETWLKQNPHSTEIQKNKRLESILSIDEEIRLLFSIGRDFDKTLQPNGHNLLYTEKCYDF